MNPLVAVHVILLSVYPTSHTLELLDNGEEIEVVLGRTWKAKSESSVKVNPAANESVLILIL